MWRDIFCLTQICSFLVHYKQYQSALFTVDMGWITVWNIYMLIFLLIWYKIGPEPLQKDENTQNLRRALLIIIIKQNQYFNTINITFYQIVICFIYSLFYSKIETDKNYNPWNSTKTKHKYMIIAKLTFSWASIIITSLPPTHPESVQNSFKS